MSEGLLPIKGKCEWCNKIAIVDMYNGQLVCDRCEQINEDFKKRRLENGEPLFSETKHEQGMFDAD